ncbi:MAG: hypothetical protein IKP07_01880 [Bacilli bacterium]|nr:hypothetical protein [Bacilli bacterium]
MKSTMKAILRILLVIFVVLYLGVEIFVTVCLLNYNDQKVTVFGNKSLVILGSDLSQEYKNGDLVVVTKGKGDEVKADDFIFFYNPSDQGTVNFAQVNKVIDSDGYYTYLIGNDYNVYYEYYVGKDTQVYNGVGGILRVLESRWGFLILIILPTMIAIIFEVYAIIVEIIELKKEV